MSNTTTHKHPLLEVHDLTVAYEKKPVLYGIDFQINEPGLIGIMGPNGAGKSTLIKAIIEMVPYSAGWVKIYGQPIAKKLQKIGYVPQRESIDWDFPVNVRDVVLMGTYGRLGLLKRPGKKERKIVDECLEKVNMLPYANRQISNLSGGQQQRVFIARALAQQSEIYLMDEPFAGVDAATEASIIKILQELKEAGKIILVVHHDLSTAVQYFDKVMLLNAQLIAFGKTLETFNEDNLQRTYGGRLTILSEVIQNIAKRDKII